MRDKKKDHASMAGEFIKNEGRADWHDGALWWVRQKRDRSAYATTGWEELREAASAIKNNVISNLHDYLLQFEENLVKNGVKVHWAKDADEHNKIVLSILKEKNITEMVKSKSMLTEECHLNEYLQEHGISVVNSDLGEYIQQLDNEPPSHIVMPCIHKTKEEIGTLFHKHLGAEKGQTDPTALTRIARKHLRNVFLNCRATLTGVNFAVAETGEYIVCTNEGNADMGAHLAEVQIASMGIEKIIPERKHLGVFLRLLARSATGQPITSYSSHFRKPRARQEMHVILVDAGRSAHLGRQDFRNSLKCIRCGACMNTCPVYRKGSGLSYHNTIAGPIGAILAPNLDMKKHSDLPFASTLCGSCSNVCPVKIDIHDQLYKWRQIIVKEGHTTMLKSLSMKIMATVLSSPFLYRSAGKMGRWVLNFTPFVLKNRFNPWYNQREMPNNRQESFNQWYAKRPKKRQTEKFKSKPFDEQ